MHVMCRLTGKTVSINLFSIQCNVHYIFISYNPDEHIFHPCSQCYNFQVASVEVPPFMALHFINAYEQRDDDGDKTGVVIADCCEYYADPSIIKALALHRLRSSGINKDAFPDARYTNVCSF